MSFAEDSKNTYFTKTDLQGNYTYVSPYFIEIFNLHPEDIYGTSSLDTIYFEDHAICYETVQKCFLNPKTYQKVVLRKPVDTEKIIWTRWEFYIDTDEQGNPTEMLCYGQNISDFIELKQLADEYSIEFKKREIKFQTLFETSSLFIILHTAKGEILDANQIFCDLVGIDKNLSLEYNLLDFIEAYNHQDYKNYMKQHIVGFGDISLEIEMTNKEGSITPISINSKAFHDEKGEIFIWTIAKDITERTKQKQQLENQKELLEQTATIAKLGGWEIDLLTHKIQWTKEIYKIHDLEFDYEPKIEEEYNFYPQNDKEKISNAVKDTINEGKPFDIEVNFISAKQNKKWLKISGRPVYHDYKMTSIKGTIQDITGIKNHEETILKQNTLLKEILFAQSHLIRLPIANILGLAELLNVSETEEDRISIVEKIKFSTKQLDEIIRSLADKNIE